MAQRFRLSAYKANKMLEDGQIRGKILTGPQKRLFRAIGHGWQPTRYQDGGGMGGGMDKYSNFLTSQNPRTGQLGANTYGLDYDIPDINAGKSKVPGKGYNPYIQMTTQLLNNIAPEEDTGIPDYSTTDTTKNITKGAGAGTSAFPIAALAFAAGQLGSKLFSNSKLMEKNEYGEYADINKAKTGQLGQRIFAPEHWFDPGVGKQQEEAIQRRLGTEAITDWQNRDVSPYDFRTSNIPTFEACMGGRLRKRALGGELTRYNGLPHYLGGIELGESGNEVEDGETRFEDYIFSKKLKFPKMIKKKLRYGGRTFADISKRIENQAEGYETDVFKNNTFMRRMNSLMALQESERDRLGITDEEGMAENGGLMCNRECGGCVHQHECGGYLYGNGGRWIQKAVKGMRKDKPCTGAKFGSSSCPPGSKRYNLAKTFKSFHKQHGGPLKRMQDIASENAWRSIMLADFKSKNYPQDQENYYSRELSNLGTRLLAAGETGGLSTIGDALYGISPEAAEFASNYLMIPHTNPEDLEKNRYSWLNRMKGVGNVIGSNLMVGIGSRAIPMISKKIARGINTVKDYNYYTSKKYLENLNRQNWYNKNVGRPMKIGIKGPSSLSDKYTFPEYGGMKPKLFPKTSYFVDNYEDALEIMYSPYGRDVNVFVIGNKSFGKIKYKGKIMEIPPSWKLNQQTIAKLQRNSRDRSVENSGLMEMWKPGITQEYMLSQQKPYTGYKAYKDITPYQSGGPLLPTAKNDYRIRKWEKNKGTGMQLTNKELVQWWDAQNMAKDLYSEAGGRGTKPYYDDLTAIDKQRVDYLMSRYPKTYGNVIAKLNPFREFQTGGPLLPQPRAVPRVISDYNQPNDWSWFDRYNPDNINLSTQPIIDYYNQDYLPSVQSSTIVNKNIRPDMSITLAERMNKNYLNKLNKLGMNKKLQGGGPFTDIPPYKRRNFYVEQDLEPDNDPYANISPRYPNMYEPDYWDEESKELANTTPDFLTGPVEKRAREWYKIPPDEKVPKRLFYKTLFNTSDIVKGGRQSPEGLPLMASKDISSYQLPENLTPLNRDETYMPTDITGMEEQLPTARPGQVEDNKPWLTKSWMNRYGLPMLGYGLQAASGIGDIIEGVQKPDVTKFPRIMARTISGEKERTSLKNLADLTRNISLRNLRNVGLGKGAYTSNIGATTMGVQRGLGEGLAQSYQNEANINAQILNQRDMTNAQIAMQETIANEMNKEARKRMLRSGIGKLSTLAGVAGQQYNQARVQRQILEGMKTGRFMVQQNEDGSWSFVPNPEYINRYGNDTEVIPGTEIPSYVKPKVRTIQPTDYNNTESDMGLMLPSQTSGIDLDEMMGRYYTEQKPVTKSKTTSSSYKKKSSISKYKGKGFASPR